MYYLRCDRTIWGEINTPRWTFDGKSAWIMNNLWIWALSHTHTHTWPIGLTEPPHYESDSFIYKFPSPISTYTTQHTYRLTQLNRSLGNCLFSVKSPPRNSSIYTPIPPNPFCMTTTTIHHSITTPQFKYSYSIFISPR